jgi:hypothetical protein
VAAAVAIAVALIGSVLTWGLQEYSDRRKQLKEDTLRNRGEYRQHGLWLNQAVFQYLPSIALTCPLMTPYRVRPEPSGLSVTWLNNAAAPVEQLPNWNHALSHLRSDPRLDEGWGACLLAVAEYYETRSRTTDRLIALFTELVRREYGPEMNLDGPLQALAPPSCDVAFLAWFRIARAANPGWMTGPFYLPTGQPYVTNGNARLLWGRDATEADPARLQRIWDTVWAHAGLTGEVEEVVASHRHAVDTLSVVGDLTRRYSNLVGMTQDFDGECDECSKRWKPR